MNLTDNEPIPGDGFLLRTIEERDAGLLVAASRSDVPDWTFIPRDLDEERAWNWIRRGLPARRDGRATRFVIEVEGVAAGTVGAQHPFAYDQGIVETFYFILPAYRRRGLATAALKLLTPWARRVAPTLRRLQLHVIVGNPGSGRVALLAGYSYEGVAVHKIPAVNGFGVRDAEVYGLGIASENQPAVEGVLA